MCTPKQPTAWYAINCDGCGHRIYDLDLFRLQQRIGPLATEGSTREAFFDLLANGLVKL